jgi:CxxC motif-containing protein (DUF1111 family)
VLEDDMRFAHLGAILVGVLVVSTTSVAQRGPGGTAVAGLTPAQQQAFDEGRRIFAKQYTMADGLGPVFNDESCADCHRNGGGSNRTVTRFGRLDRGTFDPLAELGGSLIQARGVGIVTTSDGTLTFLGERVPAEATVTARRRSTSLQGLGLVDAVPDDTWRAIEEAERLTDQATAGRAHLVRVFSSVGQTAVGKFGWKAQVPSLFRFSGEALLNEMGITNPGFRDETCPQGNCALLAFNPHPCAQRRWPRRDGDCGLHDHAGAAVQRCHHR